MSNNPKLLICVLIITTCAVLYNLQYSLINTSLGRLLLLLDIIVLTLYNKFIGLGVFIIIFLMYCYINIFHTYEGLTSGMTTQSPNPIGTTSGPTGSTGSTSSNTINQSSNQQGASGASGPSSPQISSPSTQPSSTQPPTTQPPSQSNATGSTGSTGAIGTTVESFLNGNIINMPYKTPSYASHSSIAASAASFEGYSNIYRHSKHGIDRITAEQNIRPKQSNSMFSSFFNKKQIHPKPSWSNNRASILYGSIVPNN